MSALAREIYERVSKLDEADQQRILDYVRTVEPVEAAPEISFSDWLAQAEAFQAQLKAKYGDNYVIDSQSLLDEIREERLNDILGGG